MALITQRQRIWRLLFLLLLTVAILGPWGYDLIHVPGPYTCSLPNVRVSEEFCGIPFSLITHMTVFIVPMFRHFGETAAHLAAGEINPLGILLFTLVSFSPFIPFLTAGILILSRNQQRWQPVHLLGLGLAGSLTLFLAVTSWLRPYPTWRHWGLWLYLALALGALIVELMVRRANQATQHPGLTGGSQ
jgi:hypothetical protein